MSGDRVGERLGCGSTSSQEKRDDQNAMHRKLVLTVLRSATLERVDDGLALVLGGLEAVGVLAVDEEASDETDEEAGDEEDEVGHRLGKFSEEGGELGFEFRDPFGVRLDRFGSLVGHAYQIFFCHLGVAEDLTSVFASDGGEVFGASPSEAGMVDVWHRF